MQHGGDLTGAMARHGGSLADWLDLSTGINPHAYPLPALAPEAFTRLPAKAELDRLIVVAREGYAVPRGAEIVAAPGTSALIALIPRLVPAGPVAVFGPTYGEHASAWRAAGSNVLDVALGGGLSSEARHAVVVHPNNPDGAMLSAEMARRLAETVGTRGGILVIDESFVDLEPQRSHAALCATHPVVVLRSFGKFYGLAGVRLGFAVAGASFAGDLSAALGPWAVSGPALGIGVAALADVGWAEEMRVRLATEAAALDGVLGRARLTVIGGTSLYRLARHARARALHEALAARRIWVRRFDWAEDLLRFGLPGSAEGLGRLEAALAHG